MSYQPAKSFRNRMKHAFEKLSIDVNQFSAPDMVHFDVSSNALEMVITISDIAQPLSIPHFIHFQMVVNQEFSCNQEINVLPHTYATSDLDFLEVTS